MQRAGIFVNASVRPLINEFQCTLADWIATVNIARLSVRGRNEQPHRNLFEEVERQPIMEKVRPVGRRYIDSKKPALLDCPPEARCVNREQGFIART